VLVLWDLTRSNRPSDRRCVDLWNGPANQTNRSLVRGRSFLLATVRGAGPNKAGEQECAVLLREREDGPWLLAGCRAGHQHLGGVGSLRLRRPVRKRQPYRRRRRLSQRDAAVGRDPHSQRPLADMELPRPR
jgi:hypothetical protein